MTNTLSELGLEGDFYNLIKSTYTNPTANRLFSDGRLLPSQIKSKTRMFAVVTSVQYQTGGLGQGKRVLEEKLPGAAPPPGIFILEENFED